MDQKAKVNMDITKADCLIDLHLHLDGSLSLKSVKALAALQGMELKMDDDELWSRLSVGKKCRDLNEYLEKFDFPLSLMQKEEAITQSLRCLCSELKEQGLMYAEIRFAPQLHTREGLSIKRVVQSAVDGIKDSPLMCNLIICCMRGKDTSRANLESVRIAREFLEKGVCAVDLAGAESIYENELFKNEISLAARLGVPITLHAGEASGANSVRTAVDMGALRIGHGVRSCESPELLSQLSQKGIFLELCPTSNLNTGIFKTIEEYPIRTFIENGVSFGINTDNMSVSATNIKTEWSKIIDVFELAGDEIYAILSDTVGASFASCEQKLKMREELQRYFNC